MNNSELFITGDMLTAPENSIICANFFVSALNGRESALVYLENLINTIDPLYLRKKRSINEICDSTANIDNKFMKSESGPPSALSTSNNQNLTIEHFHFDVLNGYHMNDSLDAAAITLAIQIPNDKGLASAMIGRQGENINDIKAQTGVKVNLENTNLPIKDRAVFFMVISHFFKIKIIYFLCIS